MIDKVSTEHTPITTLMEPLFHEVYYLGDNATYAKLLRVWRYAVEQYHLFLV